MIPTNTISVRSKALQLRTFHGAAGLFLAALLLAMPPALGAQVAGEGRAFSLVLPYLSPSDKGGDQIVQVHMTSQRGSNVSVAWGDGSRPALNLPIGPGGSRLLQIDTSGFTLPFQVGRFNRSLQLRADNPITVTVVLDRGTASEAYEAIPHEYFGFEYVTMNEHSFVDGSVAAVIAIEDSTIVEITPAVEMKNGQPAGVPFTIRLDEGEVYQVVSGLRFEPEIDDDLSGTRIVADRPVGLFSGSTCSLMPRGNRTCNPLLEQLPHVDALGKRYVLPLFPDERSTFMKGVPVCSPTDLTGPDLFPVLDETFYGDSGTTYETIASGVVETEHRILLAHLSTNLSRTPPRDIFDTVGDPTMSILVPEIQMAEFFRFQIPMLPGRVDGNYAGDWIHHITVTRTDPTTTVLVNGLPMPFSGSVASARYASGFYEVAASGPVSVTVNGRSVSDAYAFVPGIITRGLDLASDTLEGVICPAGLDTIIVVRNRGDRPLSIDSATFLNGLRAQVTSTLPLLVPPRDSVALTVRFEGSASTFKGRIILFEEDNGCPRRVMATPIELRRVRLRLEPGAGSTLLFGLRRGPISTTRDTVVTLINVGRDTVEISDVEIEPARFTIPSGDNTPLLLAPGDSMKVTVRLTTESGDPEVTGMLRFIAGDCPDDPTWRIGLYAPTSPIAVNLPDPIVDTLYCSSQEFDTLTTEIINQGDSLLVIDSVRLAGGEPGEFVLIGGEVEGITAETGEKITVRVIHRRGGAGVRSALLTLSGNNEILSPLEIPLSSHLEYYDYAVVPREFSFGLVGCDTVAPRSLVIENSGTVPIETLDALLLDGVRFSVMLVGSLPLPPGERLEVQIRPIPGTGSARDTLVVSDPLCRRVARFPVDVDCLDAGAILVALPDTTGAIGERIELPISLLRTPSDAWSGIRFTLTLSVEFPQDLIRPDVLLTTPVPGVTGTILGERRGSDARIVDLLFEGIVPNESQLGSLPVSILLGSGDLAPLRITAQSLRFGDSVEWSRVGVEDGSVQIEGFCEIGGRRRVDATGTFGMKVLQSVGGERLTLAVDLVEDGPITIELFTPSGSRAALLYRGSPGRGSWKLTSSLPLLPSGHYIVRLQTATRGKIGTLIIER